MAVSQRTDVGGQKPIFQRVCGRELLSLPQEALGAKTVATFRKHALEFSAPRSLLEPRYHLITDDFNCALSNWSSARPLRKLFSTRQPSGAAAAFWVRYTIFIPTGRPQDAIGELWAVVFNASTGRHVVAKTEVPFDRCTFSNDRFAVGESPTSELAPGVLVGRAGSSTNSVMWNLGYEGDAPPVFDLPLDRYEASFPKAKALVGVPMAHVTGTKKEGGEKLGGR